MGLFKPAWMGNNARRALRAIAKIDDPVVLSEVVLNAPCWEAKQAAISKITDDSILIDVLSKASKFTRLDYSAIKNISVRSWAKIKYDPPKRQGEYLDNLLAIEQEKLLLDVVDRIPLGIVYGGKNIARLLHEKKDMPDFSNALWKLWIKEKCKLYEHNRMSRGAAISGNLSEWFRDLPWAEHCPSGFPTYILEHGNYKEEDCGEFTIKESTQAALCYVFETLYQQRSDFRPEIISLNGYEIASGSMGGYVGGTGDDDIRFHTEWSSGWYLYIDLVSDNAIKATVSYGKR